MVKLTNKPYVLADDSIDAEQWLADLAQQYRPDDLHLIQTACQFNPDPATPLPTVSLQRGLAMADLLRELKLDAKTLAAAILYSLTHNQIVLAEHFDGTIVKLVHGVTALDVLSTITTQTQGHLEKLRKMLLAMAGDVRTVLIKLAEQITLIRNAANLSETDQQQLAHSCLDVYASLANRLGIAQWKWELEDRALRYLDPITYKQLSSLVNQRRVDRERYVIDVIATLKQLLASINIPGMEIMGRAKHIYSIYRKMQRKHIDYHQVYDVIAVRVLVSSITECYQVLSVVHEAFAPITQEFDDYIANPKPNGYRSIHTAVVGPEGRNVEVQIRTFDMHRESELGVAAHWGYKEGGQQSTDYQNKIAWLRQVLEWQKEVSNTGDAQDMPEQDPTQDRIYVFTPAGEIMDLPQGATAIDFAYHLHSELGHRCRGAKVNGAIVPLTYHLKTADRIEILTTREPAPSRDWLNRELGYVYTTRARAKIQHWFKQQLAEHEQTEDAGEVVAPQPIAPPTKPTLVPHTPSKNTPPAIRVKGMGQWVTYTAKCCKPLPGDAISGFITQGQGVSIHRSDCANLRYLAHSKPQRLIEVEWGTEGKGVYPVDITVLAHSHPEVLGHINHLLLQDKVALIASQIKVSTADQRQSIGLTLEIKNLDMLSIILAKIKQIPHVTSAQRIVRRTAI